MPQEAASTIPQTAACGSCSATAEALQTDTCLGRQPTRNVAPDAETLSNSAILRDKARKPSRQITSSQEGASDEDELNDDGIQGMRHAKSPSGGRRGDHERAGCESHVYASVSMPSTTSTHAELQSVDGKANSGEKKDEPMDVDDEHDNPKSSQSAKSMQVEKNNQSAKFFEIIELSDDEDPDMNTPAKQDKPMDVGNEHDNPKNGQSATSMQVKKNNQSAKFLEIIELSDDEDQDMNALASKPTSEDLESPIWYCLGPTGHKLGPCPMSVLKVWNDTCDDDLGLKIWRIDQNPEEAVFLTDAIRVKKRKIN
ncbi:zinc finger CCCH domain-containing protein 19-like [Mercurialis annua]|uniref:zinc finger CCCH domain-containing protein 19-like n=1 Tax=Mercurialis annua TaxID=3986 RepID=UPI0024AEA7B9|nr:zinc finger CCCH domain-containing protein 19-like [Mercurialis annua]